VRKGIILMALSLIFWLLLAAWILAPDSWPWMEKLWLLLGRPGWVLRAGLPVIGMVFVVFTSLRLLRSGP